MNLFYYKPNYLALILLGFAFIAPIANADSSLKRFVVVLNSDSLVELVQSQEIAFKNTDQNTNASEFDVKLKEDFRSESESYALLEASAKEDIHDYLASLNLKPISITETQFTNSPAVGGGPTASVKPRSGHQVFVIERGVPGISSLPEEKQIEISKGSQQVVSQFGDSLEWDRSFLTQEGTFCVYRTDNEEYIKEHASIAGFPADKISMVKHNIYNF